MVRAYPVRMNRSVAELCVALLLMAVGTAGRLHALDEKEDLRAAATLVAERSDYNKAGALLDHIIAQDGRNAEAQFLKAQIYYAHEQFDSALPFAEKAINLASGKSDYHLLLGKISGSKARLGTSFFSQLWTARKAKAEFEKAVQLNPQNIEARLALMDYYYEAPRIAGGSRDEAFNQAKEIGRIDASAGHTALADLHEMANNMAEADKEYKLGIEAAPGKLKPYLRYLLFLFRTGKWQEAEPYINKAREISPANVNVLYFIARLDTLRKQKLDEAARNLQLYLTHYPEETFPTWALAHFRLGEVYELQGRQDLAIREYQQSLDLMPHFMPAHNKLKQLAKK